ncbi:hypothetical protein DIPPA_30843 [Diplonema papillatum]|nr:hypothetical protein DIPPA_30843 [Diplonema papillatum]
MAHLARAPAALASFAGNCSKYAKLSGVYHAALEKAYPMHAEEVFAEFQLQYLQDERKGLVVIPDLQMDRKTFTEMLTYGEDIERMSQPLLMTFLSGGASLFALPFWANATHKLPSTFFSTEDEIRAGGKARDQEVHIKHAPICAHTQGRFIEYFISNDTKFNEAFDSINNGFMAPKNPEAIREMGLHMHKMGHGPIPFLTSDISSWLRGREMYEVNAFLGKQHFFVDLKAQAQRFVAFYRNLLQEDALIQKEGLSSLNDLELYKICNRRLIARWEEDLTRAQLEARLSDWLTLCTPDNGVFVPIKLLTLYQTAHFKDPGYIDDKLESLDTDAFPTAQSWAADAFERRVEFESGPLSDEVRAHLIRLKESEAKLAEEQKAYLAARA